MLKFADVGKICATATTSKWRRCRPLDDAALVVVPFPPLGGEGLGFGYLGGSHSLFNYIHLSRRIFMPLRFGK